jgi:hypothetical protein
MLEERPIAPCYRQSKSIQIFDFQHKTLLTRQMGAWGWMYDVEDLEPLIHAIRVGYKKT